MTRTSTNYLCTLDVFSTSDMQILANVRKAISVVNKHTLDKKRVVVRGRKPIYKKEVINRYSGKRRVLSYDWAGNIVGGLKNASVVDVYIYNRYE